MSSEDKIKKILEENPEIWKTESAYFSYLRGCIRLAWSKNPVKLKLLKKIKKQIPNPNYGKPRNTKPTVMGGECEICKNDFPMRFLEVDHRHGGTYSLRSVDDIQGFFESVCIVSEDDLRVVCKDCHGCLTYAARNDISFEQARIEKQFIQIKKDKKVVDNLRLYSVQSIPKLKKDQESLLRELLLESISNEKSD